MRRFSTLDCVFVEKFDLSLKAAHLYSYFIEISLWADVLPYEKATRDNNVAKFDVDTYYKNPFYICYYSKILDDLSVFFRAKSSLSDACRELEKKGLIEYILKKSTPAIRLTNKVKNWNKIDDDMLEQNEEQEKTSPNVGEKEIKKQERKNIFALKRKSLYENLSQEYKDKLKDECFKCCVTYNVPKSEYEKFVAFHRAKGNKFVNWLMAYVTWCHNYNKWNEPKENTNKYEKTEDAGLSAG